MTKRDDYLDDFDDVDFLDDDEEAELTELADKGKLSRPAESPPRLRTTDDDDPDWIDFYKLV